MLALKKQIEEPTFYSKRNILASNVNQVTVKQIEKLAGWIATMAASFFA